MEKIDEIISLIETREKNETKNFFIKYLKKWPWFVLFCIIGGGIGYFYYKNSPNTYLISSRILIKNENNSIGTVFRSNDPMVNRGNGHNMENQIGILKSYTLFSRALNNLDWQTSWYRKELMYNTELYQNEPFELVVPPNALNAKNVPIEIEIKNANQYTVKAEGETNINGYNQAFELEETATFGKPFVITRSSACTPAAARPICPWAATATRPAR